MKTITKIILIITIILSNFWLNYVNSWYIDLEQNWYWEVTDQSIVIDNTWNIWDNIETLWFDIILLIKYLISWILLIFIVIIWIQMVISMWTDEDSLTKSKKQILYTIIWLAFINIPWRLFDAFKSEQNNIDWTIGTTWISENIEKNLFINIELFRWTLNGSIVELLEIIIFAIAIFVIILSWIKIILSAWKNEDVTEAKNKIVWSIVWLIFIWFIEMWKKFVYKWDIADWVTIFRTIENLMLFFAWPVAIFFLTLAWYYYITSNWEEERMKKAKNIVINTVIATIILLASHSFLKDLADLSL